MKLLTGTGWERLLEELEKIDGITTIDSFFKNGESMHIYLHRKKGKLFWSLDSGLGKMSRFKKKGGSLGTFTKAIDGDVEVPYTDSLNVLCFKDVIRERDCAGNITSRWILVDPDDLYLGGEDASMEVESFTFTETEFMEMAESGIAIYDSFHGTFYPLKRSSLQSVGKFADCAGAFKDTDQHPIGGALLLAERLAYKKHRPIRFICRTVSGRVKSVINVVSAIYQPAKHSDFFKAALDEVAKGGIYEVGRWKIEDNVATADVSLACPGYSHGFLISAGDSYSSPMQVTAYTKKHGRYIYLKTNKCGHKEKMDAGKLFQGMWDAFRAYEEVNRGLGSRSLQPEDIREILSGFERPLGVERFRVLKKGHFSSNGKEFFKELLNRTGWKLPSKQKMQLCSQYFRAAQLIDERGKYVA